MNQESFLRDDLNRRAARRMAILRPLKLVIDNYPEGQVEAMDAVNNPEDEHAGKRKVPFSRELFIERDDFQEAPPPKFFRLRPGGDYLCSTWVAALPKLQRAVEQVRRRRGRYVCRR